MADSKKKYLLELSSISSPYFISSTSGNYKLHQQTLSKFSSPNLLELYPDISSKSLLKYEINPKARPFTSKPKPKLIESITEKKIFFKHTENLEDFKKYMQSLVYLKSLEEELNINFLMCNSEENIKNFENFIPIITHENLSKEIIVESLKALTISLRSILKHCANPEKFENLWRGLLKVVDYCLILNTIDLKRQKKGLEEISDLKISEIQKIYDALKQDYDEKTQDFVRSLENLKQINNNLEVEISLKARIIADKDRKIEEMNNFDNKNFTIYRLKRMIKGLSDFITETENEHESQEKVLENISRILEVSDKLNKPPMSDSKFTQTNSTGFVSNLNIAELTTPILSLNPLYNYLKPPERFISITDTELLDLCEEVLRKEITSSYSTRFLQKIIENGKDSEYLFELLTKLKALQNKGLMWPVIYRKLLGVDTKIFGKFWEFIKTLDHHLKSPQYLYFVEFDTVLALLYRIFKNESNVVHRIIHQIEIYEPIEETKSFQKSSMKKVEVSIVKLVNEIKKKGLNLVSSLSESVPKKTPMISKGSFTSYVQSLNIMINERGSIEIWEYLFGPFQSQIKSKVFMSHLKVQENLEKAKRIYVDKFDVMARLVKEWEKKQEHFIGCLTSVGKCQSIKDIDTFFKLNSWELPHKVLVDLLLMLNCEGNWQDNQYLSLEIIKIPTEPKKKKA